MSRIPSAPEVARRLADALDFAQIPYAIGGAIAYGLYAPPRTTNDVDLNIFVGPEDLDPCFDAFEKAGATVDRLAARSSATERGDFTIRVNGMRVDVFIESIPLSPCAGRRVKEAVLLGRPVKVLSPEDLVLFKLLFYRPKDINDVERLVRFQGSNLDREYVHGWLEDLVGKDDPRMATWLAAVADE